MRHYAAMPLHLQSVALCRPGCRHTAISALYRKLQQVTEVLFNSNTIHTIYLLNNIQSLGGGGSQCHMLILRSPNVILSNKFFLFC